MARSVFRGSAPQDGFRGSAPLALRAIHPEVFLAQRNQSQSAGLDAIYLMDYTGHTLSASNAKSTASFKGQNYGYRPYFQAAQRGELGEFYGIGATTGQPGYFYAIAVNHPFGAEDGVIAIKADLAPLQDSWQASGERILLANADGVVNFQQRDEGQLQRHDEKAHHCGNQ